MKKILSKFKKGGGVPAAASFNAAKKYRKNHKGKLLSPILAKKGGKVKRRRGGRR